MIRSTCFTLAVATALAATPAAAQEDEPDRILSIGAGGQFTPEFPGADDLELGPLFTGFVRREGEPIPFRTPDDGIGFSIVGRDRPFEFGPLVQFQSKRDEEDVGIPVGDVDFTVEAGAFANINFSPSFRIRLEGMKGVGGHEGLNGTIAVDYAYRGQDTLFTIGPRLRFNDDEYADAYFRVTPAVAAVSGVPAYDPDGGLRSVGAIAGITHQISRRIGVYAYAGYDRLVGDAADSPIVQAFGSEDQFSAGVALFFSFSLGNIF